jgi:outer membrane biosynthesis protein TonB
MATQSPARGTESRSSGGASPRRRRTLAAGAALSILLGIAIGTAYISIRNVRANDAAARISDVAEPAPEPAIVQDEVVPAPPEPALEIVPDERTPEPKPVVARTPVVKNAKVARPEPRRSKRRTVRSSKASTSGDSKKDEKKESSENDEESY